jgi:ABC-2 type transport system ATP-binding protein
MKNSMRQLAADGVAIILSSHLLDLVEEVCTHLLILKEGRKLADGSVAEVRARYMADGNTRLEDVFFRATGEAEDLHA